MEIKRRRNVLKGNLVNIEVHEILRKRNGEN